MNPEHRRAMIYDYIDRFVIAHRRGPTLAEIADEFRMSTQTVQADLRVLRHPRWPGILEIV